MNRSCKHYVVVAAPIAGHTLVCFSVDSVRPDSYMGTLEKELQKKKYTGEVLLDLLATNGESRRRFMRLQFDGEKLHWLQAKTVPLASIDMRIVHFCQKFYATHPTVLSKSILSLAAQHRIRSTSYAEA